MGQGQDGQLYKQDQDKKDGKDSKKSKKKDKEETKYVTSSMGLDARH
jgi:hypothetical protein